MSARVLQIRNRAAAILVVAFVASMWPGVSAARPLDLEGTDWEGLADFVALAEGELDDGRVRAVAELPIGALQPADGVIVVHPEVDLDVDSLAAFMREGGRVVLLDDFGKGDQLLRHFGLERVAMTKRPMEFLRDNPAFALAEPIGGHPVVKDVHRVVTNHASGVRHADLSPVLVVRGSDAADVLLAEAGAVGQGRLLAVGDGSVVMNSMLRFAGNRAFAVGLVHYAVEDEAAGRRGGVLYIVSNDFRQDGTYGTVTPSRLLRDRLRGVRGALSSARKEGLPPVAVFGLVIALGLALVAWVASRAGRLHARTTPRYARPTPLVAQGGVAGHAAVLASPAASPALALLEIKSALEEELSLRLRRPSSAPLDGLLGEAERQKLLPAEDVARLRRLLLRMADVEAKMISRKAKGLGAVRESEVLEAAGLLGRVMEAPAPAGVLAPGALDAEHAGVDDGAARTLVDPAPPSSRYTNGHGGAV